MVEAVCMRFLCHMRQFIFYWFLAIGAMSSGGAGGQNGASFEEKLALSKPDSNRLSILSDLHWQWLGQDLKKAEKYALEEIALAQKLRLDKWIAQGYNDLGIVQQHRNELKEALTSHKKAYAIRKKHNDVMGMGSSLSKIGTTYTRLDSLSLALKAQLEALRLYRSTSSKAQIGMTLGNICYIYETQKQYALVATCATEALAIAESLADTAGIITAISNLSNVDNARGDLNGALQKQLKAYQLARQTHDSYRTMALMENVGVYYSRMRQYNLALGYLNQAYALAEQNGDINTIILYQSNKANALIGLGRLSEASALVRNSIARAQAENLTLNLAQAYTLMGDIFARGGQGDSAVKYYHFYTQLTEKQFSSEIAANFSKLQTQHEIEVREHQKALLQKDNALQADKIQKFRLLLVGLVVVMSLVVLVFLLMRTRAKLLQQQQQDADRLAQQELRTQAVLEAEENERVRIARELHDGIGQQLSAAKLNFSGLAAQLPLEDARSQEMMNNALGLLDDAVSEVRNVSHTMLGNGLLKAGLAGAVRDFIHKISHTGSFKIDLEMVGMHERLEPTKEMVLFRVLQELVGNIIKHAHASQISIQLIRHEAELVLLLEDNGVGFDTSQADDFQGIGLRNIYSRIEFLGGTVHFDSTPGKGTTVTVEVPISAEESAR